MSVSCTRFPSDYVRMESDSYSGALSCNEAIRAGGGLGGVRYLEARLWSSRAISLFLFESTIQCVYRNAAGAQHVACRYYSDAL